MMIIVITVFMCRDVKKEWLNVRDSVNVECDQSNVY